jgi:5-methylthioribose kinase
MGVEPIPSQTGLALPLTSGSGRKRYEPLDSLSVVELVRPVLPTASRAEEIGDGNLNLIFRVFDEDDHSVIVKQALPYLRIVGESWPLTLERARIEADALALQQRLAPGLVPRLLGYDADRKAIVMEDLRAFEVWRTALNAQRSYPRAASDVGRFCGHMIMGTSNLLCDPTEWKSVLAHSVNPELCAITEDLVFSAPYVDAPSNDIEPHLTEEAGALRSDRELLGAAAELRHEFRTRAEAFIHGDLHTGSVMVSPDGTRIIDPEFAFVGPMGFDSGAVLGNLAIAFIAHREQGHHQFAATVARDARTFWDTLADTICELWPIGEPWQDRFMANLLSDSAQYAGAKMIRRIVGLAHVSDITGIDDRNVRRQAQVAVLRGGRALVCSSPIADFADLWELAVGAT